jgi:hypothetical protein
VAVNAASEAAPVIDVPVDYVDAIPSADGALLRSIREIVPALQSALADQVLLHETGLANWTRPAGSKAIDGGYRRFAGPAAPTKNGHAAAAGLPGAVRAETYVGKRPAAAAATASKV